MKTTNRKHRRPGWQPVPAMPGLGDCEWHEETRAMMRAAFAPVSPALVTMFWQNRATHVALCRHKWQCSEDGWTCRRCGTTREPFGE